MFGLSVLIATLQKKAPLAGGRVSGSSPEEEGDTVAAFAATRRPAPGARLLRSTGKGGARTLPRTRVGRRQKFPCPGTAAGKSCRLGRSSDVDRRFAGNGTALALIGFQP